MEQGAPTGHPPPPRQGFREGYWRKQPVNWAATNEEASPELGESGCWESWGRIRDEGEGQVSRAWSAGYRELGWPSRAPLSFICAFWWLVSLKLLTSRVRSMSSDSCESDLTVRFSMLPQSQRKADSNWLRELVPARGGHRGSSCLITEVKVASWK